MNVAADDLALLLRIGDAGEPVEEQVASHRRSRAAAAASRKRSTTCCASSSRSRPLSTKMHVSRSPMARWMSIAATVESTPPDSPQTTLPVADLLPDPLGRFVDERRDRPVAGAAADVEGEVAQDLLAVIGVRDFGMEQQRVEPRSGASIAAIGALSLRGRDREPRRHRGDDVAVARPDRSSSGMPVEQPRRDRRVAHAHQRVAELAVPRAARRRRRACRSSAACRSRCRASARRDRARARSHVRRAVFGDAARPAGQDDADRLLRARVASSGVLNGRISRVDRQLAQPARDQLGELRAEIEDENGLMGHVVQSLPMQR